MKENCISKKQPILAMTPDYTCGCTIYSHVVPKKKSRNRHSQPLASSTGTILTSFSLNVVRCPIDDVVLIDLLLLGHVTMLGWTVDRTFAEKSKVERASELEVK